MYKHISHIISATILATTIFAPKALQANNILELKESIKDSNIVYPQSFETNTDELLKNWYIQNYTILDDNVASKDAGTVSDAEYVRRLQAIPSEIEMPFNSVVKSYITMYAERRRTLVETMLGMSLYYMPIFEQSLEKYGLPLELKYLPVIESALNPNAVSPVGASGLWQFMIRTAKGLGLDVNTLVDERRDPYRASDAAARYLKELHDIYGDWSLAIAAYNCGPGNVNKALRRAGDGKKDFWEIYAFLPAETRGYVPGFIAANYIMTYFNRHNISPALARRPLVTDTVQVTRRINLNQIAAVLGLPIEEIRILNPHFRRDIIPGDARPYTLTLPTQQIIAYVMSEDSIAQFNTKLYAQRGIVEPVTNLPGSDMQLVVKTHKVRSGENLKSIAKKYGVTVASIKKANNLKSNKLKAGRRLKINTYKRVARPKESPKENAEQAVANITNSSEATSQTGIEAPDSTTLSEFGTDTLTSDSTRIDESDLFEPTDTIVPSPDDLLDNPDDETADDSTISATTAKPKVSTPKKPAPKSDFVTHKVRRGESLGKIARKYRRVTINDIKKANNLKSDNIKIGQKLKIPVK